ncbi:MAG: hypothetical protein LBQ59_01515 [Candidatus Peribacteria bacterium]|nr:hypothetical protein [Candidatus Peribacteria bacterium]
MDESGNYAYIAIYSATTANNRLYVIDISNKSNPSIVKYYTNDSVNLPLDRVRNVFVE